VNDVPGARRYKEVVAGLSAAADALRERDRQRAGALARRVAELHAAMTRASERAALTRFGARMQWDGAVDALWQESWMTLRTLPDREPGPEPVGPADLDELDTEVERAAAAVRDAVRKRFGFL